MLLLLVAWNLIPVTKSDIAAGPPESFAGFAGSFVRTSSKSGAVLPFLEKCEMLCAHVLLMIFGMSFDFSAA